MDCNEISKMNLNRDQLQYLAMVKSGGTKGQLEMLKNSDMQNKILSQRGVQKERRELDASYAFLYDEWQDAVRVLLDSWERSRVKQLEAELTSSHLVSSAQKLEPGNASARNRLLWQIDAQRSMIMQRGVEIETVLEELNEMKEAITHAKMNGRTFEFAEI